MSSETDTSQPVCERRASCACDGQRCVVRSSLLVALGVTCVALGAVGVVLPGLPTTIFLIIACWCFARSVPWLEHRLVRIPLFRPFVHAIDTNAGMPRRAKVISLVLMWAGVLGSSAWMLSTELNPLLIGAVLLAGIAGTLVITLYIPGDATASVRCGDVAACSGTTPQPLTRGRAALSPTVDAPARDATNTHTRHSDAVIQDHNGLAYDDPRAGLSDRVLTAVD